MVMVMLVSLLAGCGDDDDDDDDDDDYRKPTEQTTPDPGGNGTTQDPPGGNSTTQDPPGNPSEALLKVGADPDAVDADGKTYRDYEK